MTPPELAVREGCPQPPDLPRGEFRCRLAEGEMVLDHADPRILISAELLHMIAAEPTRWACLDTRHLPGRPDPGKRPELFVGALLKISAVNRNVVYRITGQAFEVDGYIGEWPE